MRLWWQHANLRVGGPYVLPLLSCAALACTNPTDSTFDPNASPPIVGNFTCAEVIGFSQTRDWYNEGGERDAPSAFEQIVDNDRWQLRANASSGVERWAVRDYAGWEPDRVSSHCTSRADNPDLAILTISGPHAERVDVWAMHIRTAIDTICGKYDAVRTIGLQPVIGNHAAPFCATPSGEVRASWQHPYIFEAITNVVSSYTPTGACADGRPLRVVHGYDPHVRTCDDFADGLGHLTDEGSLAVGQAAGAFYAMW